MQEAGASDKQAALTEMREAKKAGEEQAGGGGVQKSETLGKVEQFAGKATGCEGMEEEGGRGCSELDAGCDGRCLLDGKVYDHTIMKI